MIKLFASILVLLTSAAQAAEVASDVIVPRGIYQPFFRENGEVDRPLGPLVVDRDLVTNQDFLEFVRKNPKWRRSKIPSVFSAPNYLEHWKSDTQIARSIARHPVTNVTWFAARKYCQSKGKRLMTIDEWEFVADGQNPSNIQKILDWYGRPNKLEDIRNSHLNAVGLRGMHGLVWEWVDDFNSVIMAGDSRDSNDTSSNFFCGAGSLKAKDPAQYATFMRYAYRSSLKANHVGPILGFRCAKDLQGN